jgi:hypothetical protein
VIAARVRVHVSNEKPLRMSPPLQMSPPVARVIRKLPLPTHCGGVAASNT